MVYKYLFLIFSVFNILFCYSQNYINNAEKAFSNKNYIEAIELFKMAIIDEKDNLKVNSCLKYIADSYFIMGFYDKAQFYYEKLVGENTPINVLDNLFKIFLSKKDYKNAEIIVNMFPDGPGKDKLLLVILEYKKDKEKLFEVLFRLYTFYSDIYYFEKLIEIDSEKTKKLLNRNFDVFLFDFIVNDGNISDNKLNEIFHKMTSSDKIRMVLFLEKKKSEKAIYYAKLLYNDNGSDSDFERYIRILFNFQKITQMKEEIEKKRKKVLPEKFLNTHYSLLNSLSLNDEIISIIKSIKNYEKDKNIIYKLVDVYRYSMSYNTLFLELEKSYKDKSLQNYEIENIINSLLKSNINWAIEFAKSSLFENVSAFLQAKTYHYSADYQNALDILYKNTNIIEMFVNSVKAHSVYAEIIDINKVSYSEIKSLLDYFTLEKLEKMLDSTESDLENLDIFELIMRKKRIKITEFDNYIANNYVVKEFIKRVCYVSDTKQFKGIEFYRVLFENTFQLDNATKYRLVDEQFNILRMFAVLFFNQKEYELCLNLYEKLFLQKDFLYLCVKSINEKKLSQDIRAGNMFYELELAKIIINGEEIEKKIADLFFEKENYNFEN
ncbi:MAG: hypothetical protein M0R46_04190 [Candidatus Muirbacterium halophilum]|nr:hypothetical protein [Candidatus Muirbacterium halophilum]MCK9475093.1 hypothetical protein [Candidatus Muirbacterium halophilum]